MKRNYDDFGYGVTLLANQTITGSGSEVTESGVDCKGITKGVLVIDAGTFGGTFNYQIQTSADDGSTDSYADVLSADGSVLDSADEAFVLIEVDNLKRYCRIQYTGVSAADYEVGIGLIGWDAISAPVS